MSDSNPTNSIEDLREHLFETLAALRDPVKPMDIERAKAISDVAQTIINSAKVEVEFMKISGTEDSKFLRPDEAPQLPPGITGIVQHRLR